MLSLLKAMRDPAFGLQPIFFQVMFVQIIESIYLFVKSGKDQIVDIQNSKGCVGQR